MKKIEVDQPLGIATGIDESGRRFTCTIYKNLRTGEYFFYHLRKKYKI